MTPLSDKNVVELRHAVEMVDRILELLDAYDPTLILVLRPGGSNRLLYRDGESRRSRRGRRRRDRELGQVITVARFTYRVIYIVKDVLLALAM